MPDSKYICSFGIIPSEVINALARQIHESWRTTLEKEGWKHGASSDVDLKTHYDLVGEFDLLRDKSRDFYLDEAFDLLAYVLGEKMITGHLGDRGIRDPENPCRQFVPGVPSDTGTCESDGHYLCNQCEQKLQQNET